MKIFLNWFRSAMIYFGLMSFLGLIIKGDFEVERTITVILVTIGGAFIAAFGCFLLEGVYMPWQRNRILKKICVVFEGEFVSESVVKFQLNAFEFFAEYKMTIVLAKHGSKEIVSYHLPESSINLQSFKPRFELVKGTCNGQPTYCIYSGLNVKKAKRNLDKMIKDIYID